MGELFPFDLVLNSIATQTQQVHLFTHVKIKVSESQETDYKKIKNVPHWTKAQWALVARSSEVTLIFLSLIQSSIQQKIGNKE